MIKFNTALVAAALLISGSAMAASIQPLAGNLPAYNQTVNTSSATARSAVEAQAAAQRPVAGNIPFIARTASSDVQVAARSGVVAEAVAQRPAAGNAPYQS
ncbi:MAG: hypothetical protein EPN34_02430 [Burkholderiaceae bacterium]|nr:MAG: hypothetical protein EPN34_02430 [Burkholderiaceae bacterium]